LLTLVVLASAPSNAAQPTLDHVEWSTVLGAQIRIEPNLTYLRAGGWDGKLDVYLPRHATAALPTFVNIHGGGWLTGSKEEAALEVLPYLAMGFAVVNVGYRLAHISPAPGAVEDCRCALRWVVRHARQYGFDTDRLVIGGSSAGGHLALMAGMASANAGFDVRCPGNETVRVAAIVNYFGIVDLEDLISGPHRREFAVGWLGKSPDGKQMARWLSPLAHVSKTTPPILTIHGDQDPVVPPEHAARLHAALTRVGVANRLLLVPGGKHGDFGGDDMVKAQRAIREFLASQDLLLAPGRKASRTRTAAGSQTKVARP
jgi:acetyl esterase/lipase